MMPTSNTGNTHTPHVLIIGAGLGGLVLAQCLRKRGISFDVFERDEHESARGPGYALGLYNLAELQPLLPDDVPPLEQSCHLLPLSLPSQLVFYVGDRRVGVEDSASTPCTRANRSRLRQLLSTNLSIRWGKKATRIDEDDEKATVWFDDGTSASGDVIVGADGTFSAVREYMLQRKNSTVLHAFPESIIIGHVTLSGALLEQQLRLGHSGYIAFGQNFRVFGGVSHVLPDGKSAECYWVLYKNDDAVAEPDYWMKTASREQIYQYCLDTLQDIDPRFSAIVQCSGPEGCQGMRLFYHAQLPEPRVVNRVVMIGDAAHPIPPFRGEGGIVAMKDATKLSETLSRIDATDTASLRGSLAKFQRECIARGSEHVALSRTAMAKAAGGDNPTCWGYKTWPMEEKALGISLS